ncbi:hypothetical protein TNCV_2831991 [Trichonephila clavipes]|nr:hypothetical protein TNCV_2831991 [Trichonephila clavipes]
MEYAMLYEHKVSRYVLNLWTVRRKSTSISQKDFMVKGTRRVMHRMLTNLHHYLCEYGSLLGKRNSEREQRDTRSGFMEQNVLYTVRMNSNTSARATIASVGGSWDSVHRALQDESLHPSCGYSTKSRCI